MYVLDENKNLVENFTLDQIFDIVHPIGEIYVQYPNQNPPLEVYGRGNWEDISSQYAGLFFRAEGGNSLPFQGGVQDDKIRSINAQVRVVTEVESADACGAFIITNKNIQLEGGIEKGSNFIRNWGIVTFDFNANINNNSAVNGMIGHADGPEIRPINTTIRIWKRIE